MKLTVHLDSMTVKTPTVKDYPANTFFYGRVGSGDTGPYLIMWDNRVVCLFGKNAGHSWDEKAPVHKYQKLHYVEFEAEGI